MTSVSSKMEFILPVVSFFAFYSNTDMLVTGTTNGKYNEFYQLQTHECDFLIAGKCNSEVHHHQAIIRIVIQGLC